MSRVEVIGDAKLYLGDCMEILPTLPKVDAVITSPPYNMGTHPTRWGDLSHGTSLWAKAQRFNDGYGSHSDDMPQEEYEAWQKAVLTALWDRLTETGAIFYNHKPRPMDREIWLPLRLNPGLPLRQVLIWDRGSGFNFSPFHFCPRHEWICLFAKRDFALKSRGASGLGDVWSVPPVADADHPCSYPLAIPALVLEALPLEAVILDPFMGSGTTGVASVNAGRKFHGIEMELRHFDTACRRIEQAYKQRPLFEAEPVKVPEQMGIGL